MCKNSRMAWTEENSTSKFKAQNVLQVHEKYYFKEFGGWGVEREYSQ